MLRDGVTWGRGVVGEGRGKGEGGRNSSVGSVLGSLSYLVLRRGFDPPVSLRQRGVLLGS